MKWLRSRVLITCLLLNCVFLGSALFSSPVVMADDMLPLPDPGEPGTF